ncbi:helix-turn-helix domain-containing protein [Paenibacillus ginsengarvi]|uniref:AraC family transcriptional regulator n=1 Tax=Paenibacillus ginsengarvi TaxID=400777 RepID=A0A3B0CKR3_9BACL|nr:helix-turn-helix domain-containing protein [Paenibacillus ginsengarvi]RKN84927.1 AraC family transcriptional regulator [Paenibacillus ginsengarvi]
MRNRTIGRFAKLPFRRKLLLYSLLLSIMPVLTVGLLSSYIATRSIQQEVDQNHLYMLNQMQVQLNQFMKSIHTNSIFIATNISVEKSVREGPGIENLTAMLDMNETIRRIRSTSPVDFNVSLLYKKYNGFAYSNKFSAQELAGMRLLTILEKMNPVENEAVVVPPGTFDDQPDLLLFRPVPIGSAYTDGVLVLHVSPNDILRFVGSMEHSYGTRVMVADEQNRIVISSNYSEMGKPLQTIIQQAKDGNPEEGPGNLTIGGQEYKVYREKSSANNWTYIALTSVKELTAQSDRIRLTTWIVVCVLVGLWTLLATFGSRRMYVPIQRLSERLVPRQRQERGRGDGLADIGAYVEQLADTNRQLHNRLNEQFPYLRQGVFQHLLRGELTERELNIAAEHAGMALQGEYVYVCVAEADDIPVFDSTYREKDRSLIHYALLKMLEETFHGVPFCAGFTPKTGQVVLLIGMNAADEEAAASLKRMADDARRHVREYFRFAISVAIGSPLRSFTAIGKGYEEAVALLGHRFILGEDRTIAADQADEGLMRLSRETGETQKMIVHHVLHGNMDDSRGLLEQLVQELRFAQITPETARGLFSYMLGELDYMLQQTGCDIRQAAGIDVYRKLHGLRSLPELEKWLTDELFPAIKAHLAAESVSKQTKTIREVMSYVRHHLDEDMTLQKAADHFSLSVSYLSKLFKDEAGLNFSEYVLGLRMNKAKEWLEHTDMPIKDIADKIGYASVQNFNRVFKQWSGVPPGEFRKEKRQASG